LCLKHKIIMKVDHKMKVSFYHINCDFCEAIFVMSFLSLGMHIYFFLHWGLHLLNVLYNKLCSLHYVCFMWKETIEKISGPKEKRCIIFFNVLPLYTYYYKISFICDLIIKLSLCITSLPYSTIHMTSIHL